MTCFGVRMGWGHRLGAWLRGTMGWYRTCDWCGAVFR